MDRGRWFTKGWLDKEYDLRKQLNKLNWTFWKNSHRWKLKKSKGSDIYWYSNFSLIHHNLHCNFKIINSKKIHRELLVIFLQVGQITKWKEESDLSEFYPSPCSKLTGSAGEFFPPNRYSWILNAKLNHLSKIFFFNLEFCKV